MHKIGQCYRLFNILSLDVALGSVVSAIFLAKIFDVLVKAQGFLCLGLAVWLIYTVDHLVDAKSIVNEASTPRHRFHQRNFKFILMMACGILMLTLPLLFLIYTSVLIWGLCLGVLVVMYFAIQKKLGFLKEFLGAILYSGGVMLPIVALATESYSVLFSYPALLFFNTALINLVLFSWFDKERDLTDKHSSLVTVLGDKAARTILCMLFVFQLILIIVCHKSGISLSTLSIFASMWAVLLAIYVWSRWFSIEDRYRLLGDAIFLMPIVYVVA